MKFNEMTACLAAMAITLCGAVFVNIILSGEQKPASVQAFEAIDDTNHCEPEETTYWYPTETNPTGIKAEDANGTAVYAINYGVATLVNYEEKESAQDHITVEVPPEIEGYPVRYIGEYCFSSKKKVTKVILPDSITEIGEKAFYNNSVLQTVVLSSNLQKIGIYAFANCTALTEIDFPDSLESIGIYSFSGSGLKSIRFPSGLKEIPLSSFANCISLQQVDFPEDTITIVSGAFSNTGLQSLTFTSDVIIIGYPFKNCKQLTSVTIEDGITEISGLTLTGCESLKTLMIPSTVETIQLPFENCTALRDIYYAGTTAQWESVQKTDCYQPDYYDEQGIIDGFKHATIHCADGDIDPLSLGDLNHDNTVNASDAALILIASAEKGAVKDVNLTEQQKLDADVNKDGSFDASDAAVVLIYSAAYGSGQNVTLQDFIK